MANIPDGVYTLRNVRYGKFAAVRNSDDQSPLLSDTTPMTKEANPSNGYKWRLTRYQDGKYTFQNHTYPDVFAGISFDAKDVSTTRNAYQAKAIWHIDSIPGVPEGYLIKSVTYDRCWHLRQDGIGTPVVLETSSPSQQSLWVFESDTHRYPSNERRETRGTESVPDGILRPSDPLRDKSEMVVFDFQSTLAPNHKLDIVLVLASKLDGPVPDRTPLRRIANEIGRLAKANSVHVDLQLGGVTYATTDQWWPFSTFRMVSPDHLNDNELGSIFSPTRDLWPGALNEALKMNWRRDAAKIIIFQPSILPKHNPDIPQSINERDLIKKLVSQHFILAVNADEEAIRDSYLDATSFFRDLQQASRRETVSLSKNLMVNWIFSSTFYTKDIKSLIDIFHPNAKLWSEEIPGPTPGHTGSGGGRGRQQADNDDDDDEIVMITFRNDTAYHVTVNHVPHHATLEIAPRSYSVLPLKPGTRHNFMAMSNRILRPFTLKPQDDATVLLSKYYQSYD